ncbi:hypothetical protein ID810_12085 [Actinomyces respiraculi]|uniref:Type ISP restriction-modification enzyme LLaBIII C-terminal specificity domain-containing protein n=1 Tax=Actinomyces respiraculi TaxID=2744574 RepID=A0A7T0PW65_9ACTO|nr:hypothetical protein ID810_12085 [Actinomyces respiraculi]
MSWAERAGLDPSRLRVEKMRYATTREDGTKVDDKSAIVYNEHITISGIPEQAQDYLVGSCSALDWLLDRYQIKFDKASGIVNDPNDWMDEGAGVEPGAPAQPLNLLDLIARVTTVSVRTHQIVHDLSPLTIRD